jgi:molybdopterin synthase catalytic subunit
MDQARFAVTIQVQDFDPGVELERLHQGDLAAGGIASFIGLVRDLNLGDQVEGLTLQHYPGMTEKAIQAILEEAETRWPILGARVIHRVGPLTPGDRIVMVAASAPHRGDAFAACEFIMDYLKTRAPFWKKEQTPQGPRWVEARQSDRTSAERWKPNPG